MMMPVDLDNRKAPEGLEGFSACGIYKEEGVYLIQDASARPAQKIANDRPQILA